MAWSIDMQSFSLRNGSAAMQNVGMSRPPLLRRDTGREAVEGWCLGALGHFAFVNKGPSVQPLILLYNHFSAESSRIQTDKIEIAVSKIEAKAGE